MTMKVSSEVTGFLLGACLLVWACATKPPQQKAAQPRKVGYSIALKNITPENMAYAKSVGVDYIETSFQAFIDDKRQFKLSEAEIRKAVAEAKQAADKAGIKIWSIHMPYSKTIDISLANEQERQAVVALHQQVLTYAKALQPQVILFHPSYYLGLNERETRKAQMIKSSGELLPAVQELNATMVIENMLGPELLADANRERPLCRSVEETLEIMGRLPKNIYAAVDMNHIKHPERLIRALGKRLKSIHVADGHGEKENHFLPCSGQGGNDWPEILAALDEVNYQGPFLFESAYKDVKELKECYLSLHSAYVAQKKIAKSNP
ncbi:sugar phosphate isomerase/epimerase family protein [Rufibacter sediminis]